MPSDLNVLNPDVPLMNLQVVAVRETRAVVTGLKDRDGRYRDSQPSASQYVFLDVMLPCGTLATVIIDGETYGKHFVPLLKEMDDNLRAAQAAEDSNG